jgi:NTE family protein
MNHSSHLRSREPHRTALVLGGGGSTGNAWLIGIVAGLFEEGLDVTAADLTVGTSAGSTAAVQFVGASPTELLADILAGQPQQAPAGVRPPRGGAVADQLERIRLMIEASTDAADYRRRMGAAALERAAASDGTWPQRWRDTVASRLPDPRWPERTLLITAVDAETGEPVVFDRSSGVDLVDAVAASCSSGTPFPVGERRYIDGGFRSNADNADLASGTRRVLVLSPLGGRALTPAAWGTHLATQVDGLRAEGAVVETVFPEHSHEQLFGDRAMDAALRPAAARAGHDQGRKAAARLHDFWQSGSVGVAR